MATHVVTNQVPPLPAYDLYRSDPVLTDAVAREGGGWAHDEISEFASAIGTEDWFEQGRLANVYEPVLHTHDAVGNRIDEVEYHPAYHRLMAMSLANGLHSLPFERPGDGGRIVRDAKFMAMSQVEAGHGCPISMTTSCLPALRAEPALFAQWKPYVLARGYRPDLAPVHQKGSATLGMSMTEKQGGSDVRANTTLAHPNDDGSYRLVGHKWFTSAPMCDAFLVLAQAPTGLTCFLLPRVLPDGTRNPMRIQRLKHKVGNRSNASSEVEYDDAIVWRVGEEGRGVRTILEMVGHTRLDCVVGSTALMRQAVTRAAWHTAHRHAFGAALIDKALMVNVLADLELEVEVSTLMMARLSGAFDRAAADPAEAALMRLATPVAKYWVTKRCSEVTREAMECLGGNGFTEDLSLARLFRESPVNAIWEGSGNVIALDVVRALSMSPRTADAFIEEIELADDPRLRRFSTRLKDRLASAEHVEANARRLVDDLAVAWGASLALRWLPNELSDAWIASRVEGDHGHLYGTLNGALALRPIADRALIDA